MDLLLTDVILPEMSGKHLASRITERHDVRRVAFLSGYDDGVLARHGAREPGIHLLQKPFYPDDLLRFVRRVLDEDSSRSRG